LVEWHSKNTNKKQKRQILPKFWNFGNFSCNQFSSHIEYDDWYRYTLLRCIIEQYCMGKFQVPQKLFNRNHEILTKKWQSKWGSNYWSYYHSFDSVPIKYAYILTYYIIITRKISHTNFYTIGTQSYSVTQLKLNENYAKWPIFDSEYQS
jgi:hypothetical protein